MKPKSINPNNVDDSDFDIPIDRIFEGDASLQQPGDIAKELFHEDKVKARTELSVRQVKAFTKAFFLAEILESKDHNISIKLKKLLLDFLTLNISKDRASRKEFVETLKAKLEASIMANQPFQRGSMK